MATVEQRQEMLESVTKNVELLAAVDASELARTTDLSPDINFKDAVPRFEEMLELCKQLRQRDLSRLTYPQLRGINSACETIAKFIKNVREFDLNQNTPGDVCKAIITQIDNSYDGIMEPFLLPLAFTATQSTDYAKIEREAKGYHATMKAERDSLSEYLGSVRTEAEKALSAVKAQAAEAGVASNAQIFADEATTHNTASGSWLKATIVMIVVTFIVSLVFLVVAFKYRPADMPATIQYISAKLLVLSTLSVALFWSARNYKAHKHNATLCQHRANALMTFRAFVEGTSEEGVKDAILLQAAQAAFAGRSTGFDVPDGNSATVTPFVEVLGRTVSPTSDS
jgi:hypothetical protein